MFGNNTNSFGSSSFSGFGQPANTNTTGGLFGNKSAFGTTNTQNNTFGSTSTFGSTNATSGGLFGSKPASTGTGLFGSTNTNTFGGSTGFGNTTRLIKEGEETDGSRSSQLGYRVCLILQNTSIVPQFYYL